MKYFFLALLAHQPTHGYDLLQTHAEWFGAILPPLNAGQIYTTLARLERDGMVEKSTVQQAGKPDKQIYELTEMGRQALQAWFEEPVTGPRVKDTFFMKLFSARLTGLADPRQVLDDQRTQYLQNLHDLNELSEQPGVQQPAKRLLIQGAVLHLKADLEWLDHCEELLDLG